MTIAQSDIMPKLSDVRRVALIPRLSQLKVILSFFIMPEKRSYSIWPILRSLQSFPFSYKSGFE
jgi:hypothetical protein